MELYMSKSRADCGSRVARPKIENKDNFELKGQFLKELRTNTFSGSDHEDANEHIKKVLEIVDLFHILNITIDQTVADAKIAIQEMAKYSQKWNNGHLNQKLNVSNAEDPITPKIAYSKKKGRPLRKLTTYNLVDLFKEGDIKQQRWDSIKETMRNQGDDLIPTIKEGEVIEEFRTKVDELDDEIDDYPSYCDYDKNIHIDYKMVYKGNNVVGALMNVPIFFETFSVVTDFAVLENMDDYRDEGMGDVIFGKPFFRDIGIKQDDLKG
uniref:MAK10-like protein n=1 Tax=Tanacetum cinerariifolium TaxID=118510 RepID=A0A6L2K0M8_TANCI|nr:hypothetical protein [Tanacetum cinerariifolium]